MPLDHGPVVPAAGVAPAASRFSDGRSTAELDRRKFPRVDSNHGLRIQRPPSYQLDDVGSDGWGARI